MAFLMLLAIIIAPVASTVCDLPYDTDPLHCTPGASQYDPDDCCNNYCCVQHGMAKSASDVGGKIHCECNLAVVAQLNSTGDGCPATPPAKCNSMSNCQCLPCGENCHFYKCGDLWCNDQCDGCHKQQELEEKGDGCPSTPPAKCNSMSNCQCLPCGENCHFYKCGNFWCNDQCEGCHTQQKVVDRSNNVTAKEDHPPCASGKYDFAGTSTHRSCSSPSWDGCNYQNCEQKIQAGAAVGHCYTLAQLKENDFSARGCNFGSDSNTCAYDDAGKCVYSDVTSEIAV